MGRALAQGSTLELCFTTGSSPGAGDAGKRGHTEGRVFLWTTHVLSHLRYLTDIFPLPIGRSSTSCVSWTDETISPGNLRERVAGATVQSHSHDGKCVETITLSATQGTSKQVLTWNINDFAACIPTCHGSLVERGTGAAGDGVCWYLDDASDPNQPDHCVATWFTVAVDDWRSDSDTIGGSGCDWFGAKVTSFEMPNYNITSRISNEDRFGRESLRPTTSPSIASVESLGPTTSPSFASVESRTEPPAVPPSTRAQGTALGSQLASEVCVNNNECANGICGSGVCDPSSAMGVIAVFAILLALIGIGALACFECSRRRSARLSASVKDRADKLSRNRAVSAESVESSMSSAMRLKADRLLALALELHRLVHAWPNDLDTLRIRKDMSSAVWSFEIQTFSLIIQLREENGDATLPGSGSPRGLASASTCAELEACGQALLIVCDRRNGADKLLNDVTDSLARTARSSDSVFDVLQAAAEDTFADHEWGFKSKRFTSLRAKAISLLPAFVEGSDQDDDTGSSNNGPVVLHRICSHPVFYGSFWVLLLVIFGTWLGRIGSDSEQDFSGPPGGFGNTFLPVPPQYDTVASTRQKVGVPLVFGFMHCALACLALLPLTLCRALWRDITDCWPGVRKLIPVDDFVFVHRALGLLTLALIAIGATTWMIVMAVDCIDGVPDSCLAFEPRVANFFDPVENVVALRIVILLTWFPLLPLMMWARASPPSWLPQGLRQNWYEMCLYVHIAVAAVTLIMAVVARFEVFFPVLPGWLIYALDWIREAWCRTPVSLVEREVFSRAEDGIPTSMNLKFRVRGESRMAVTAGQWVFLQVPGIDMTWHPFSLLNASSAGADEVELLIAIRAASTTDWLRGSRRTRFAWRMRNPTWTFRLYEQARRTKMNLTANIRGPYGSKFVDCFDPEFGGAVLIGAGTGLTAALSLLRETIQLRAAGVDTPPRVWFVWSCRKADDLLWCWDALSSLLIYAVEAGLFEIDEPTSESSMFDWLGITIYVTRSSPGLVQQFAQLHKAELTSPKPHQSSPRGAPNQAAAGDQLAIQNVQVNIPGEGTTPVSQHRRDNILAWLVSRIIHGSLDSEKVHINKLLFGARAVLDATDEHDCPLSVAFCGPSALAATIEAAIRGMKTPGKVQFNADHQ